MLCFLLLTAIGLTLGVSAGQDQQPKSVAPAESTSNTNAKLEPGVQASPQDQKGLNKRYGHGGFGDSGGYQQQQQSVSYQTYSVPEQRTYQQQVMKNYRVPVTYYKTISVPETQTFTKTEYRTYSRPVYSQQPVYQVQQQCCSGGGGGYGGGGYSGYASNGYSGYGVGGSSYTGGSTGSGFGGYGGYSGGGGGGYGRRR